MSALVLDDCSLNEHEHISNVNLSRTIMPSDARLLSLSKKEIGKIGEELAVSFYRSLGYKIIEQNWTTSLGEADIVAQELDQIVLCEVKTSVDLQRRREYYPELRVDSKKRHTYRQLASIYLSRHPENQNVRFDIVAITYEGKHAAFIRHLKNAFTGDDVAW